MDQHNAISVMEKLIESCKDGQKGYQDAASHAKRTDLVTFFNEQSLQRAKFAGELQSELVALGKSDNKESGSIGAAVHRAWIDTKVALGGGGKTILESVERGEDSAKEDYEKALGAALRTNLTEIVRRQAAGVRSAHDRVKGLRDAA